MALLQLSIIADTILNLHSSDLFLLPDSDFLYKLHNVTTVNDRLKIPDTENCCFIFENYNSFNIVVTFSLSREKIAPNNLIGGSIMSGLEIIGFIIVLIFRKRSQSAEAPIERN